MPVSVVCESASVNSALRESIANSANANSCGQQHHEDSLQNKLVASAKRVLLTKIEYEEVNNFNQNRLDTFKSKYIVLKPTTSNNGKLQQQNDENNPKIQTSNGTATPDKTSQRNPNELPQPKRMLYPRESIQIGWKSSNRKLQIGAGMMNVGNTCYLNSTLQALFHVPAIANWLISDVEHRERCEEENGTQGGCIICAMSKTLINSQSNQSAIRPYLIYTKLKSICKHLTMGRQEDAHEFLRYLVEAMEKSYLIRFRGWKDLDQYSKETTPLNQILGGYLKSAVSCLACGHVSTTFQHFEDILLDIRKADTVEDALDVYFARERLEDMGYKCEACKKKVSATKQFSLERAPISLCIQLKRFSMMGTKLNKHIAIRPRLDLSKFSSKRSSEQLSYKLVAMVTHLGASQHCGHYTAIGLTESGTYYQFDDSCVRPISVQSVVNTNAYIIFYELDGNQQQNSRQTSTQISGNHQSKDNNTYNKNGYNNHEKHYQNSSTTESSSSALAATVSNGPKVISKLDTTIPKIIGPQLPENYRNGYVTNGSKLVNSPSKIPNGKPTTPTTAANNKLTIQFKSSNGTNSPKLTATSSSGTKNNTDTELIITNDDRSTLPSMPKLGVEADGIPKTPLVLLSPKPVTTMPNNTSTNLNKTSGQNGHVISNGIANNKSPLKSLVPYESESDDSDDNDNQNNNTNTDNDDSKKLPKIKRTENQLKCDNNAKSIAINNQNKSKSLYDSDDDYDETAKPKNGFADGNSSNESSPNFERSKSTPPSPPVIKSKTGLWQVTTVGPTSTSASPPEKKHSNPFVTQSSTSTTNLFSRRPNSFYGEKEKKIDNGKKSNGSGDDKTVNELLKYSNRGYGAPVLSWNGQKTELDKEISEETRLERKREYQDEEENEMDRGRQKKVRIQGPNNSRENPGYNPFQEHQNQQNGNQRRWKNFSNGGNRFNNQNNYNHRNNNFNNNNRHSNNFKKFNNKFHQKSNHQRNNNSADFHRRDS